MDVTPDAAAVMDLVDDETVQRRPTRSPTLKQWNKVFRAALLAARPCESMSYIIQKAREEFESSQW